MEEENIISVIERKPKKQGHYEVIRTGAIREKSWFPTLGSYDINHKWTHPRQFLNLRNYLVIEDVEFWVEKESDK